MIINQALSIMDEVFTVHGISFTEPNHTKDYCRLNLGHLEHEVFGILFLSNRHQLIKFSELSRGTINGASVHPREVVKETLACNAAAVIFSHNHPSGVCEPSEADRALTRRLVDALALVEVRVLDHIVCSSSEAVSFAERGLL
ncbi:MAG: DNA repair protein RadC [Gammaproteobacteria bacterium]|nr:DNA repair protein RadC [Gammaproteobacteria bacterium]